jgi:leucyl aminopeptidase
MRIRLVKTSRFDTEIRFRFTGARPQLADFAADSGEVSVRYERGRALVYAGLGARDAYAPHVLRAAAAVAGRKAVALKRRRVALDLAGVPGAHDAALEGVLLGVYAFDKYLAEKPQPIDALEVTASRLAPAALRRAQAVCAGVRLARDLVNDNAAVVTPAGLAAAARRLADGPRLRVEVLDEKQLLKRGLRLLAAVGQGSPTPPRLITLTYRGKPASRSLTAIIGKGITFDSGGLNLKPSGHIETMRCDMAGAAAVLGVMQALRQLRPAVNVVGVCAAAHNAIDGAAYMPGDVCRSYSGKTVEICNTDAEGRLALADAIAYTIATRKPTEVIDLATLTGAILVTFADVLAGLFSNNDELAERLARAGEETHERLWRLPVYREFSEAMKGDRSDLRSLATFKRGQASSVTGAAFLQAFAGKTPWAHLDIAGVAFNEGEARGELPKYATGFGVRLLAEHLLKGAGQRSRGR